MEPNTSERRQVDVENFGEIKGTLKQFMKNQEVSNQQINSKLDGIDVRLRDVERKAAVSATVVSAVISVGTAIASFFLTNGKH